MENSEVARVFSEMADLLHIRGGDPHRIRSFRRTARILENLPENVAAMIRFGTFAKWPGVGPGSVRRVKQILKTGTCDDHKELRRQLPDGLRDLLQVKGIGASTIRLIWNNLKIGSLDELEYAARTGMLLKLPRIGDRTAHRILRGIEDYRNRIGKVAFARARRSGMRIVDTLREHPAIHQIALGGSVRRGKAEIGDLDILVATDDFEGVAQRFLGLAEADHILLRGSGRCSIRLPNRQQVDLRILPIENWGAGLHYFTGSALHNIAIRARGLKVADLKISDKGIFRRDTTDCLDSGRTEEAIFAAVGLPWIPPEIRENTGEIEAAAQGRMPKLVTAADLRGDLHMHTVASDGSGTVNEMVDAALDLGHEYIAITDHTQSLTIANGLDEARLAAQHRHIRDVEDRVGRIRIAAGVEVDILPDGRLDIDTDLLRTLDWVIASVHSQLDMSGADMTTRLIKAMESGVVDCIGHPTNRRLGHRTASEIDTERLLSVARRLDVALEVNGNPGRMDLKDVHCRQAREAGVPLAINTDAHSPSHLRYQEFGLLTASRGWVEPKHVLNCLPWDALADRRNQRLRSRHWVVPETWPTASSVPDPSPPQHSGGSRTDHYPDLGDEHDPAGAGPEPAEELDLDAMLAHDPIDKDLVARLEAFLRTGGDEALEAALERRGNNAMQEAFTLLMNSAQ